MTDSHPNAQVPGTPYSHTPAARATASATSKLRDSCHACALAKVRCHKEKPTCSRCATRSTTCEYFVTKRPGRKRDNSQRTSNNSTINAVRPAFPDGLGPWPGATTSITYATLSGSNNYLSPLGLSPTSPRPGNVSGAECSSSLDIFSDLLMPLEPSLSSALEGTSNDFDSFFTSPIDFLELEAPEPNNFTHGRNDIAKLLIPDDTSPDPASETSSVDRPNASKASFPSSNGQALSTSDTSVSGASDSTCCCVMQVLDLMKKLSSTKSPACALSNSPDDATITSNIGHSSNLSAQTVVMENKQTIEAVSNILQCSCAEDGYLLTMLSMIVFKILGRYAAAARKQPGGANEGIAMPSGSAFTEEQMRQLSSYCPDDEGLGRKAAQLILSELHRVQRLVNQLSPRLKARGVGGASKCGGIPGARNSGGDCQILSLLDIETTTTSFSTTLNQIEIDLRKCLSTLSSEVINMLRQS